MQVVRDLVFLIDQIRDVEARGRTQPKNDTLASLRYRYRCNVR